MIKVRICCLRGWVGTLALSMAPYRGKALMPSGLPKIAVPIEAIIAIITNVCAISVVPFKPYWYVKIEEGHQPRDYW